MNMKLLQLLRRIKHTIFINPVKMEGFEDRKKNQQVGIRNAKPI
jgi:hypothetical protein